MSYVAGSIFAVLLVVSSVIREILYRRGIVMRSGKSRFWTPWSLVGPLLTLAIAYVWFRYHYPFGAVTLGLLFLQSVLGISELLAPPREVPFGRVGMAG